MDAGNSNWGNKGNEMRTRGEDCPGATLRHALVRWVAPRHDEPDLQPSADAWGLQLRPDGMVWQNSGEAIVDAVNGNLQAIVRLRRSFLNEVCERARGSLRHWIQAADEVVASCQRKTCDWETLIENDGPACFLIDVMFAQNLVAVLKRGGYPRQVTAPLMPLLKVRSEVPGDLQFPPTPGYSWDVTDYVYATKANHERWQDAQPLVESVRETAKLGLASAAEGTKLQGLWHEVLGEINQLSEITDTALALHPVEWQRCERHVRTIGDALATLQTFNNHQVTTIEECHLTTQQLTGKLSQLATAKATPDTSQTEAASSKNPALEAVHRLRAQLEPLVDSKARRCVTYLDSLIGSWSEVDDENFRQLFGLATHLDELAGTAGNTSEWLGSAILVLREILVTHGNYRVLDRELLGQPLSRCEAYVEAVGYEEADPGLRSGVVSSVQRVGYTLEGHQQQRVLRRARVVLAR